MNEKDLVSKLSNLKYMSPRADWVRQNREVLSCQIFNGQEPVVTQLGFFTRLGLFSHRLLQPAPIAALIALFFMVSGVVGIRASEKTTPNDVLYIAKIISEKTEYAATFNEKSKAQLNVQFAKNRATELSAMASASTDEENPDPRVQELSDSFKKEIASVRERLNKLQEAEAKQATIDAQAQAKPKLKVNNKATVKSTTPEGTEVKGDSNNEGEVFSADSSKDEKGIEISLPPTSQQVLEEAEKLFNEKNYDQAVDKLNEVLIK